MFLCTRFFYVLYIYVKNVKYFVLVYIIDFMELIYRFCSSVLISNYILNCKYICALLYLTGLKYIKQQQKQQQQQQHFFFFTRQNVLLRKTGCVSEIFRARELSMQFLQACIR